MRPSEILFRLAGSPVQPLCYDVRDGGRCWLCGSEVSRGVPPAMWQGANFTDQNKARCQGATHVCEACVWACAWSVPPGFPPPELGKKGVNLRLFSHLWAEGESPEYQALNKAQKPIIRDWLQRTHRERWFAAIADSGQKHLLPWTPLNGRTDPGAGVVWFEERVVALGSWLLFDDMTRLLTVGVTKAELGDGRYAIRSMAEHRDNVFAFEECWGAHRGGGWWSLALWLAQREERDA